MIAGSLSKFLLVALLLFSYFAETPVSPETKVVVLGIAQDGGIPHIGCSQEICRTQKHFVSSLAIVQDENIFLIDATPDLRDQYSELIRRYPKVTKKNLFDGIFLTHAHMGHYTGLLYLGKESVSTKEVPVYCSEEMALYLKRNAPWSLLVDNKNIGLKPFASGSALDFGFKITPVAVPHRKEFTDTHGFLIQGRQKALLYIPDIDAWEPVKDSLAQWLKTADFALLDGTFYSGQELPGRDIRQVPHPTIEHSLMFFKTLPDFGAKIFFTHLNHTNPVLNSGSSESSKVTSAGHLVAVDWQEFTL
ncbi:MBL fold metallo-hydrolase [bacterium]|nr:MBL fold metallo-hydrolase [bacterium]